LPPSLLPSVIGGVGNRAVWNRVIESQNRLVKSFYRPCGAASFTRLLPTAHAVGYSSVAASRLSHGFFHIFFVSLKAHASSVFVALPSSPSRATMNSAKYGPVDSQHLLAKEKRAS